MWHLFGNKAPVVWMRTERPFLNSPGGQTVSVNRYKHLKKSAGWPDSAKWNKKKKTIWRRRRSCEVIRCVALRGKKSGVVQLLSPQQFDWSATRRGKEKEKIVYYVGRWSLLRRAKHTGARSASTTLTGALSLSRRRKNPSSTFPTTFYRGVYICTQTRRAERAMNGCERRVWEMHTCTHTLPVLCVCLRP